MAFHLKKFSSETEYTAFLNSSNFKRPNVSCIFEPTEGGGEDKKVSVKYWRNIRPAVTCTYFVTDITETIYLCYQTESFESMKIDGVLQSEIITEYNFNTTGIHEVEFILKDSTVGEGAFDGCWQMRTVKINDAITSIGPYAFYICDGLLSADIGNGVTSIGEGAFCECYNLSALTLGDSIVEIGYMAFNCCEQLQKLNLPESVISIEEEAFTSCVNLVSINLGSNLTYIGNYAFADCYGLSSITITAKVAPTIGDNTFSEVHPFGTLNYPENSNYESWLSTDEYYLGYYNWNTESEPSLICTYVIDNTTGDTRLCTLTDNISFMLIDGRPVDLTETYKFYTIGEHVVEFYLTDIHIMDKMFMGTLNLWSIEIGKNIRSIGTNVFFISGLHEITCHATTAPTINNSFMTISEYGTLYIPSGSDYSSWLLTNTNSNYLGNYKWYVSEIGVELPELTLDGYDVAFWAQPSNGYLKLCNDTTNIEEIKVDGKVLENVSSSCTVNTTNLWSVVHIKYVQNTFEIPSSCFKDLIHIGKITLLNTITSIGDSAFYGCCGLSSIVFPDTVTSIGNDAFRGCQNLKTITLGQGLTSIGETSFAYCPSLKELFITDSVENIGSRAFAVCPSLQNIEVSKDNTVYDSRENCNCIIETNTNTIIKGCEKSFIPNSIVHIGYGAFYYCDRLSSVEIPDSVTTIDDYAFYRNGLINELIIPNSVTSIGEAAFYGCSAITSIRLSNNLTNIGNCAFQECQRLSGDLIIPDSVISIGAFAFNTCYYFTSLYIGSGTTNIGNQAFDVSWDFRTINVSEHNTAYDSRENCNCIIETNTNTIIKGCEKSFIPNSIVHIGDYAFAYAISSTNNNIIIPNSITSIGKNAFMACHGLTSISLGSELKSIGEGAFESCSKLDTINIPNSVTYIGAQAFDGCWKLTSIEIPSSVTFIGEEAFDSTSLSSLVISSENTVYDSRENCNCIIITSANTVMFGCKNSFIPEGVTAIGNSAFRYCSGLTSIELPDSVTSIGLSAFTSCYDLTSLTLGSGLTNIDGCAFYGCSKLLTITSKAKIAPTISKNTFINVKKNGTLYYPSGSDYSSWLSTSKYYLRYYNWTGRQV